MKYEVKAPSLAQAVTMSVRQAQVPPSRKSSTTIDAGAGGSYASRDLDVDVERGRSYTISWSAHEAAGDGANYGIYIRSYDGHGNHREAFDRSGSTSFTANRTGTISFFIGVSYSAGLAFSRYPVDIDID